MDEVPVGRPPRAKRDTEQTVVKGEKWVTCSKCKYAAQWISLGRLGPSVGIEGKENKHFQRTIHCNKLS